MSKRLFTIKIISNNISRRNPINREMCSNPQYRSKIERSKVVYTRKGRNNKFLES
jgi:hypothetical protein